MTVERDPRTSAEWVALACSCLMLGLLVALIVRQLVEEREPAAPVVEVAGEVRPVGDLHHVDVVVTNDGDDTAQNVQVTAELEVDGTTTTSDQVVDFLPGGAKEDLVFVFEDDPSQGELTVVISGFSVP